MTTIRRVSGSGTVVEPSVSAQWRIPGVGTVFIDVAAPTGGLSWLSNTNTLGEGKMLKNVTGQNITALLLDTDGAAVTTGTTTVYVTGDAGTQTSMGTATHEGNGEWSIDVTQAESNYDDIGFTWVNSGAVTVHQHVFTDQSYDRVGSAGAGLTAVPWNTSWDAEVQSECADALTAYDPPTDTEMAAAFTEIKGATWASGTDTLEHIRNKQTDIEADTAEIGAAGIGLTEAGGTGDQLTALATPTNITAGTITTVTNLTNAPTNGDLTATMKASVNTEADNAIETYKLDHLVAVADADDPVNDSIVAKLAASDGDWSGFSATTDALEALRDRGDAAWTTGAGGTPPQLLQSTTIATLATQTSFTLTAGSADDDAYNGAVAVVTDQSTSTQKAYGTVDDYTGASKTVTLSTDPAIFTMAIGDTIDIMTPLGSAGSAPTAGQVADAVWDEDQIDHTGVGTFGVVATEIADVLVDTGTTLPATLSTMEGKVDTVDGIVDNILVDTGTTLDGKIDTIDGVVDNILVDTDELQTDDVPGLISALNDPTAATVADAVWNEAATGHTDAGKAGQQLWTDVDAILVDTGTTLDGKIDTIDGNVDSILVDTDTTLPGTLTTIEGKVDTVDTVVDGIQTDLDNATDGLGALKTLIDALNDVSTADINAQVLDVLNTDTFGEPTGVPGATETLVEKVGYLYMALRNKVTVTATKKTFYDDGDNAEWEKDLSDDTTTYTETEANSI